MSDARRRGCRQVGALSFWRLRINCSRCAAWTAAGSEVRPGGGGDENYRVVTFRTLAVRSNRR